MLVWRRPMAAPARLLSERRSGAADERRMLGTFKMNHDEERCTEAEGRCKDCQGSGRLDHFDDFGPIVERCPCCMGAGWHGWTGEEPPPDEERSEDDGTKT